MVFINKVDHVILEVELVSSSNEYFGSLVLICAQEELQKYKTDNAHVDFLPYSCFI
ncbi:hypothetical protein CsSME_00003749 [Camellia sinensis var. sinensis]